MAKALDDCMTQIQTVTVALSGVTDPGYDITQSLAAGIYAITEPLSGVFTPDQNFRKGLHNIQCRVFCPVDDYPRYRATLAALVESVYDAIRADVTLAGTCDTITSIGYNYGPGAFGSYPVYGATFSIGVKIQ